MKLKVYTRRGDDGTTSLRHGERLRKDSPLVELNGTVDEAQAALGLARAECERGGELDELLVSLERDLWIVMAGLATPEGCEPGVTAVSTEMVVRLETEIDAILAGLELPSSFAVPGDNRASAALDLVRTIVRRAERLAVRLELTSSPALAYLNRLSDLCWVLARRVEGEHLVNRR